MWSIVTMWTLQLGSSLLHSNNNGFTESENLIIWIPSVPCRPQSPRSCWSNSPEGRGRTLPPWWTWWRRDVLRQCLISPTSSYLGGVCKCERRPYVLKKLWGLIHTWCFLLFLYNFGALKYCIYWIVMHLNICCASKCFTPNLAPLCSASTQFRRWPNPVIPSEKRN